MIFIRTYGTFIGFGFFPDPPIASGATVMLSRWDKLNLRNQHVFILKTFGVQPEAIGNLPLSDWRGGPGGEAKRLVGQVAKEASPSFPLPHSESRILPLPFP